MNEAVKVHADWCLYKERKFGCKKRPQGQRCTEERACGDTAKAATCKPRREALEKVNLLTP